MQRKLEHLIYDEDIVCQKLKEGSKETYRQVFNTYYKVLCLYATSLTSNKSSAEDIVQNVFLNLWIKRNTLNINSSLKSYLYKATYNIFINEFRKKQREETIVDKIHYQVLQNAIEEEESYLKERIEWINKEIEILPPKSKKIFKMNKKRGLTYREIAKMLGISENTVESHISRALKRIRNRAPKPLYLFFTWVSKK